MWTLLALLACSGETAPTARPQPPSPPPAAAPRPTPQPQAKPEVSMGEVSHEVPLPKVDVAAPKERKSVPHPLQPTPELTKARDLLYKVVHDHGRDPNNPWAVSHTMLALGLDVELTNGANPVDHLFGTFAEPVDVGTKGPAQDAENLAIAFPRSKGDIRIEPHSDLILKALTEGGVDPMREVPTPKGRAVVKDLYRHSLHRAWVEPGTPRARTGFDSMNDTPWALQALSSWAPKDYSWTAIGDHEMTMDGFAEADLVELEAASATLMNAMGRGVMPRKDGKGILGYTCGGQHLVQGVAHAVARGFGPDDGPARMCAQRDLVRWRIDHELGTLDPILGQITDDRALAIVILDQRLKFLGHALETLSKFDVYGYCEWTDADAAAQQRLAQEIVTTVDALNSLGAWSGLEALRTDASLDPYRPNSGGSEQVYLDLLGDAAHTVRGIDLATGKGTLAF